VAPASIHASEIHGEPSLTFTPEGLKRQNELLRALRKELAAKERDLANQKWVFEQFLQSPSWRMTYPVRWMAQQLRRLRDGNPDTFRGVDTTDIEKEAPAEPEEYSEDLKAAFASLCHVSLQSFLASATTMELPHSANPKVSIILVLFNRAELTLACLRSIAEHHAEDLELIIVDNASSDDTSQLLDRLRGPRILRNAENRNFLLAVNQAARECRGEYILLLNNDAQLLPGALERLLATIQSSPDIGAVGGKIILLDGTLQEAGDIVWKDGSCLGYGRGDNPFAGPYMFRRDVDYCSGAFLLTARRTWQELGGFDESFKPAYYEETDYCMRLWARRLRVVYEPTAAIVHYEFASASTSSSAIALQARHQRVFVEHHGAALATHDIPNADRLVHARSRHKGPRVLFLDDRVPHLWLGSGFPRANALMRALLKNGCFVTMYPLAGAAEPWDVVYSDVPREVEVMMGLERGMLESFLRNRAGYYDNIVISRPHNMEYLAPILGNHADWFENTRVIYDAEALFAIREAGLRKLHGRPMSAEEFQLALAAETSLTRAADCVVAVSESERQMFQRNGIAKVEVLGHSIEVAPQEVPFAQRQGLLFVGAVHEEASPNADSLVWFLGEVLPRIKQVLGEIRLTIAGVNKSERIRALAGPSVEVAGHVPDLRVLYARSKLLIAPTRFAAGIPHKVHEAAARGLPVVATPLLAEQLGWTEKELAIAEDAEAFAQRCVELYTNEAKWKSIREAALDRVRVECAPEAFDRKTAEILGFPIPS
jgi:O-antigen biosynthesis protein